MATNLCILQIILQYWFWMAFKMITALFSPLCMNLKIIHTLLNDDRSEYKSVIPVWKIFELHMNIKQQGGGREDKGLPITFSISTSDSTFRVKIITLCRNWGQEKNDEAILKRKSFVKWVYTKPMILMCSSHHSIAQWHQTCLENQKSYTLTSFLSKGFSGRSTS